MKDMSSGEGRLNVPRTQKGLESNYGDICTIKAEGSPVLRSQLKTAWAVLYWGNSGLFLSSSLLPWFHRHSQLSSFHTHSVLQLLLLIGMTWTIIITRWRIRLIPYLRVYYCTLYEARWFLVCQVISFQENLNRWKHSNPVLMNL